MTKNYSSFEINGRCIGDSQKPYIIAEIAQAHDGSLGIAHAYIDAAAEVGADAVKFQTHIANAESTLDEPFRIKFSKQDESRFAYWQRMEFSPEQWSGLADHAREKGLVFLSSPFFSFSNTFSISLPMVCMTVRSAPPILMPTGVLIPVASMSIRVLIGHTQALVTPGSCSRWSSSSLILSMVTPGRHSDSGLSCMTVSIIDSGAGSVAVSARPILPNTVLTSGTDLINLSVCCNNCCALPMDIPGKVVGIYMISPSFRSGINSEPSWVAGHIPTTISTADAANTSKGRWVTTLINGL